MDDALLQRVAERHGTPTYVYDLDAVRERIRRLRAALTAVLPGAELRYAVKANPSGALLRTMAREGVGAEVITLGELARARRAGIPGETLLLGGPRQDPPLIEGALEAEQQVALVSLDGAGQWPAWRQRLPERGGPRFLVRLNPGLDPRTHPHMATGAAASKFGLPAADAAALAEAVAATGRLAGFHVHAGSMIRETEVHDAVFDALAPLYDAFPGLELVDVGGGFAVPDFPLDAFAERLAAFAGPRGLRAVVEPGRWLTAEAGVLLTRVLHVKAGPPRHVIADAGMAELLRPALYGAHHPLRAVGDPAPADPAPTDLDGPLCENADRLGREVALPEVAPGALLAVGLAGAYGHTMASNYASSLRPAEVAVEAGEARLIRERERLEDLWRLERD